MTGLLSKVFNFVTDAEKRTTFLAKHGMYRKMEDALFLKKQFKNVFGYELNLENPKSYSEKLQWLKLYDRNENYVKLVDKYEVKDIVAKQIGEEHIIKTIGVWDKFEDIDFSKLPNQFVLKCTHDSGGLVICTDKSKFDIKKARKKINKSLKVNYYWQNREWPYKDVKPRIIAEEYMIDESGYELKDYKFFVFNGKVRALFIATDRNAETETCFDFYDEKFQHLPFTNGHPNSKKEIKKPEGFERMIELAEKIGKDILHCRVDFYNINGKIYFGEITFFHWSGFKKFEPQEWDEKFGKWLILPEKNMEMINKKKYVFIIPSLAKGGAERVVSLLASELIEQNREAIVITHFNTHDDYSTNQNVKIICLSDLEEEKYRKKINLFYLIKLILKLRKTVEKINPDYIIPFLWTTCIRTDIALLFSKHKKNIIQTVRNNPSIFPVNRIVKKYRDYLIKKSSMTIVQNDEQKMYFNKSLHHKIKVLPNPVSNSLFNINIKKDDFFYIIGVGRLEKQKNFELLIRTFSKVYKENSNVRLLIYGEGSLKEELQKKIEELNLQGVAKLCGRCNDYNQIYGKASLYVLSSDFEGMPNTLLEAMACGVPSIATDCPTGPKEIIEDGVNGLLVEVNNEQELYNKITSCIKDSKLYEKIKNNCKGFIYKNYSVNKITEKLIDYCEEGELNNANY